MRPLIICLGLLLTGCASGTVGSPTMSPEKQLYVSCRAYYSLLDSLATLRLAGKLSNAEIATVDAVRPAANTSCENRTIDVYTAINAVERALIEMVAVEEAHGAQ